MRRRKEILTSVMAVVCFFGTLTALYGFDEKQVQALKKSNVCKKCDLSGAKLNNLDMSYVDLSSANLSGADLSNSTLLSGNLSKANLSGANLSGTNLFEADLSGADLSKANLSKTYLDQATWTNGKRCKVGSIGECK
jgi:BTB/POZ domain-containing protein KCTD9